MNLYVFRLLNFRNEEFISKNESVKNPESILIDWKFWLGDIQVLGNQDDGFWHRIYLH